MSIIHARVDERLIHGQVATVWTNSLGAQRIMVVNDQAVKDDLQIGALKMAKPVGVKLSILSKRKAVANILDGKYENEKVFLITKNIEDMVELIDQKVSLSAFNVGNISMKDGGKAIKKSVALVPDEVALLKRITEQGVTVTAQMVPSEPNESILTFLE